MQLLEKDLAIAESNLRTAKTMMEHSSRMFKRGYVSELEVEGNEFAVKQGELELALKNTEIDVLEAIHESEGVRDAGKRIEGSRGKARGGQGGIRSRGGATAAAQKSNSRNCVITAQSSGMVIHPSAAQWKEQPDIEEGANVREDQVLLVIPDLSKMQVKVGVHESKVDRIRTGMPAKIELQDITAAGSVFSIATVTRPAGWWTGNVVKYGHDH